VACASLDSGDEYIPLQKPDPQLNLAPSWSWASVKGAVHYVWCNDYQLGLRIPTDNDAKIMGLYVKSESLGGPSPGAIKIFGQCHRARYHPLTGPWADPGGGYVLLRRERKSRASVARASSKTKAVESQDHGWTRSVLLTTPNIPSCPSRNFNQKLVMLKKTLAPRRPAPIQSQACRPGTPCSPRTPIFKNKARNARWLWPPRWTSTGRFRETDMLCESRLGLR
jgi:hypothetical protein